MGTPDTWTIDLMVPLFTLSIRKILYLFYYHLKGSAADLL